MEEEKELGKEKEKALAARVFESSRNQAYFRLRYLEQAMFYLKAENCEHIRTGSDGKKYYFSDRYLLNRYIESPDAVTCDYLHTVFHCLYQHPIEARNFAGRYWDPAADIAVTDVIAELGMEQIRMEIPVQCFDITEKLRREVPLMSAPHIARYLMANEEELEQKYGLSLPELTELFRRDDHDFWNFTEKKERKQSEWEKQAREAGSGETQGRRGKGRNTFRKRKAGKGNSVGENIERGKLEKNHSKEENPGKKDLNDNDFDKEDFDDADRNEGNVRDNTTEENNFEDENLNENDSGEDDSAKDDNGKDDFNEEDSGEDDSDEEDSGEDDSDEDSFEEDDSDESDMDENDSGEIGDSSDFPGIFSAQLISELTSDWQEIAENVMLCAQSFEKNQGDLPGSMVQTLERLTREKYDYAEFLRKFAVLEETMKLDPDEFDYLYYMYGLNRLGRVALIEPLEYREEYLVHDFVIAIDTSGSCSGELVQRFLNKTYNILKSTESFSRKVHVHVIQCDCEIQEDTRIESLEELDAYTENLQIHGLGGTDFRPVFEYVDRLCAEKEFRDLRGLIYFTDGYGTFPAMPPKYRTAFVFLDREDRVTVPPWAMKVYLDSEEEF